MSGFIKAMPAQAPYPVEAYCTLSQQEIEKVILGKPACSFRDVRQGPPCQVIMNVGVFFDGTNNNMKRDYEEPPPEKRSHTNVVRLFLAHKNDPPEGQFRFYIPGVGTPFPEIGEKTETDEGKAFAKGGQARILWGVLQVYNAIHRAVFDDDPMLADHQMAALIHRYEAEVDHTIDPEQPRLRRHDWFAALTDELSQKLRTRLDMRRLPTVPWLSLSVFGFSRGAVQARAFCHWFADTLVQGRFAGIEAEIRFLGLFDSVASVGTNDSMSRTLPLPRFLASGHSGWAAEVLKPLPPVVRRTVHYIAAHEQRMNFPVTRVKGGNVEEWLYPGVHSDVGGGYAPGDQGRARAGQASLLSQIPLLHMYKAALLAGVPLVRYEQMEPRVKVDFQITEDVASCWEGYAGQLGCRDGAAEAQVRRHMGALYGWRAGLLAGRGYKDTASYKAASGQEKSDLGEADGMLEGDLALLRQRAVLRFAPEAGGSIALSKDERAQANQYQVILAQAGRPLSSYESWALRIFNDARPEQLPYRFFEDMVHDSLAGFYLAGALTDYDRRQKVKDVYDKLRAGRALDRFEQRVLEANGDFLRAMLRRPPEAVRDADFSGVDFPVQTDGDVRELRNVLIVTQTASRREGGGYLLPRVWFE